MSSGSKRRSGTARDTSTGVLVTAHAIERYQQRVEGCTAAEAVDRIGHAWSISRSMSTKEIRSASRWNKGGKLGSTWMNTNIVRYCPVESLVLVGRIRYDGKGYVIVTILNAHPDLARKSA